MKQSKSMNDANQGTLHRACPSCLGTKLEVIWRKSDVDFAACQRCGMVYIPEVLESYATGQFYEDRTESFYLSDDKLKSDYDPVRFQREWALLRQWVPSGKVLDVGCSTGGFLKGLHEMGDYETIGCDVSQGALNQAENIGVTVLRAPFLSLPVDEAKYDAITFWAVLEHLADPAAFLAKAGSMISSGGICILLVPNLHSLAIRSIGPRYRYIMTEHLNYFSAAALSHMVARVGGWKIERVTSMHFNPVVIIQDALKFREEVPDAERAKLLKRTNRWKRSGLMRPLKAAYRNVESVLSRMLAADNLVMVLRKN
jgi:2-polyprenyl-3-methyl-5-hydroxy-6-metoxy-1,4-benzoquinol methylase